MRGLALKALVAALLLPASSLAAGPGRPPGPGPVVIYRGGGGDIPSPVPVHRGSVPGPAGTVAATPAPTTTSGRHIWLVDPAQGRLTGCRLVRTTVIGRDAIRCTRRTLPAG
jgi:hypothetical protein